MSVKWLGFGWQSVIQTDTLKSVKFQKKVTKIFAQCFLTYYFCIVKIQQRQNYKHFSNQQIFLQLWHTFQKY